MRVGNLRDDLGDELEPIQDAEVPLVRRVDLVSLAEAGWGGDHREKEGGEGDPVRPGVAGKSDADGGPDRGGADRRRSKRKDRGVGT